jgi:uncharacterized membrane protein
MTLRYVRQIFLNGLIAILPIAATAYIAIWLITGFEAMFSPLLRRLLTEDGYVPGMGVAVGIAGIFLLGLVLQAILAKRVWTLGELLLSRTPLISQLYQSLKQVIGYVSGSAQPEGTAVVLVTFGAQNTRMLGLITRDRVGFSSATQDDELVAVFLPWSYQVGGFTILVPRDAIERIDLTPQEALQFSLTAGVTGSPQRGTRKPL